MHPLKSQDQTICDALTHAISEKIPDAIIRAEGRGGHFRLEVTSVRFAGLSMLKSHQLVYGAIADLMSGSGAPVHAIDELTTHTP